MAPPAAFTAIQVWKKRSPLGRSVYPSPQMLAPVIVPGSRAGRWAMKEFAAVFRNFHLPFTFAPAHYPHPVSGVNGAFS
jgi:hypothetical protein